MHSTIILRAFRLEATYNKSVILDQHKKVLKVCTVSTSAAKIFSGP